MTNPRPQIASVAAVLVCAFAGSAFAGSDRIAAVTKFALDRCVLPVLSGAPADTSGMLENRKKTDGMTEAERAEHASRKVYSQFARGLIMSVPNDGGCTVGMLNVPVDDLRDAVGTWAKNDPRLAVRAPVSQAAAAAEIEYVWTIGARQIDMVLRSNAETSRATLVMMENR